MRHICIFKNVRTNMPFLLLANISHDTYTGIVQDD